MKLNATFATSDQTFSVDLKDKNERFSFDLGVPGPKGADGHTPEKYVDYFTEADKAEMVAAVKAQLIIEQWTFTLMDDTTVTKDVIVE